MAKAQNTEASPEEQGLPKQDIAEASEQEAESTTELTQGVEADTTDYSLLAEPALSLGTNASNWTPNHSRCNQIEYLRERFVHAILQNPNAERFTYGNPLEKGRRGDYAGAGAMLAHLCDELATDYYDADSRIDEERRERLGVNVPAPEQCAPLLATES